MQPKDQERIETAKSSFIKGRQNLRPVEAPAIRNNPRAVEFPLLRSIPPAPNAMFLRHSTGPLRFAFLLLMLCGLFAAPRSGWSWGEPHLAITKAALDVLPASQKAILGEELPKLADYYCTIPDLVQNPSLLRDVGDAKFAMMDSQPGKVYLLKLHLPAAEQPENLETLRYFMDKAVGALGVGQVGDAARFMGTICHVLEDFGSPAHTIPGDNMFTLLQQFLPPSEGMKDKLLHSPIENGTFSVTIEGYQPQLLGASVDEASWRLLHRVHEGILNARSTTIPIIQALYADDQKAVLSGQLKAAIMDARVVADALYTVLCLGSDNFHGEEQKTLRSVDISSFFPLEAVNLFYPQTHFFSSPYWGHARSGVVLEEGKAVPLKLRIPGKDGIVERIFARGIGSGVGRPLTYLLPKGVYRRFTVFVGLHPELGAEGRVEFTVLGDGKALATATVSGGEPAVAFDCDIQAVTQIQLSAIGRSTDRKKNYAIWAEPTVWKTQEQ